MVKTKSFKDNDEYFKFINNNSLMESIIIHDLKLVDGKYVMHYENIPNENESESTDEIEWPSIEKNESKPKGGNKNDRRRNKKDKVSKPHKKIICN